MKIKGLFFGIIFILALLVSFVFAAVSAPTSLVFENNVTSSYDEGVFNLNWTSGGGDAEVNYTVYVFADNVLFMAPKNDSVTGYSFSNTTEALYTFIVGAENATGDLANSSNVTITVDNTAPVITLPVYTDGTLKANTDTLTLNISVSDAASGLTGSACIVNVNGTNQSISVSSGWCNSSTINLTNLADGNQTINVYVNDTINNVGLNNSYVVWIDSTNPTATASCTPNSVNVGETVTCTCSGSDGSGSGINSSLTTASSTPSTSSTGSFDYSCSVTDNLGNTGSDTATYTVTQSSTAFGTSVYRPTSSELDTGYKATLLRNYRVHFDFLEEEHTVKVDEVLESSIKVTVSSAPVTFELNEGEVKKIDLNSDGQYDLQILLEELLPYGGKFVLTYIDEAVEEETIAEEVTEEETTEEVKDAIKEKGKSYWGWIIVLVLILVVGVIAWKKGMFKKSKYHKEFRH